MNILPLVLSFLIIFSCLSITFLREVKSAFLIENTLAGYNSAEKAIQNALVKKAYDKLEDSSIPNTEKKKTAPKEKAFCSRRTQLPPAETSKFYLRALCLSDTPLSSHPLYEPLAEFLRLLYQHTLFARYPQIKKPEYQLIEALVKKAKKSPSASLLAQLYPDDETLQTLYYKMLRGTNQYTLTEGIPPLAHFLSLEKQAAAANINFASPTLLSALFGSALAEQILRSEQEYWNSNHKYMTFSKEEVDALLMKDPSKALLLSQLAPHFSYSKQVVKKKTLAKRDAKTHIGIEKEL